eukprot:944319-Amphidinium_carterae.4
MQLRSCKLSEEQWSKVDTLYTSDVFTRSNVAELRAAAAKCPDPVSNDDLEAMAAASPLDCHLQLSYCELAKSRLRSFTKSSRRPSLLLEETRRGHTTACYRPCANLC